MEKEKNYLFKIDDWNLSYLLTIQIVNWNYVLIKFRFIHLIDEQNYSFQSLFDKINNLLEIIILTLNKFNFLGIFLFTNSIFLTIIHPIIIFFSQYN